MAQTNVFPLRFASGVQRDGTEFSATNCIAATWCRWYRGRPQKMGGYQQILGGLTNVPRGTYIINDSPNFNIYTGDYQSLKYVQVDGDGLPQAAQVDRTPSLFASNQYNLWSFDLMYSTTNTSSILIAHAPQNLYSIDQVAEAPVYYGDALSTAALTETGNSASGGIVVLHPYLFIFGNNGEVSWTEANDPTTIMDSARVTGTKIVAGLQTRGGNSSPAGLLWSLDSVLRVTNVGTTSIDFRFDTVTSQSSILSSKSVIEYDGIYYWAGVDRFLMYNGIVQELPNSLNLQYFFGNLNYAQRQKVWATKYTKYGEIWWFYPALDSTECDQAIIYNVRENTWYDTAATRSSGFYSQTFTKPVWTSSSDEGGGTYSIWRHEVGTDKVVSNAATAIESYFETPILSWMTNAPDQKDYNLEKTTYIKRLEPDFLQTGDMSLYVRGRAYANSTAEQSSAYTFSSTTDKVDILEQRRELSLKFVSNEVGGYYQMGKPLVTLDPRDTRP